METNPYAPPKAAVADPEPSTHGLKHRSVLLMVVFTITFGDDRADLQVKDMIEDHAAPDPHSGPMFAEHVKLSGLMTFFFSIYYLQWAINRYLVERQIT